MSAWLAQLDAEALHVADAEALADEGVDVHATDGHLAPGFSGLKPHVLHGLRGDERERLPRWRAVWVEVTVAFEPFPRHGLDGVDGPELGDALSTEVYRFDWHAPMMH